MSTPPSSPPARAPWAEKVERGTLSALVFVLRLLRVVGRKRVAWLRGPVTFYFLMTDGPTRRASRAYFERLVQVPGGRKALGHSPGLRDVYRHLSAFSISILDRVCVWSGNASDFVFEHEGASHFAKLPNAEGGRGNVLGKTGALIVGAHLGSFDMMRSLSQDAEVPVNVVMYGGNAAQINAFFERLDPDFDVDLIHVVPGERSAVFEIRAAIERGEFVAILADRIGVDGGGSCTVPFLGAPARFPDGPFQLAALLGCPVMLATASRIGDARYRVESELLYAGGRVPRREREKAVSDMAAGYARYLERVCLETPYQWFNFFDFWEEEAGGR